MRTLVNFVIKRILILLIIELIFTQGIGAQFMFQRSNSFDTLNLRGKYYFKSALLMDAKTGTVLYAHRAEKKIYPASLVKMMVALIALEQVDMGLITLSDNVSISSQVRKVGGRQVYLSDGEVFPLGELLKAMIIFSANDAAAAVAEHIAGSQEDFVKLMNQKAYELQMAHTHFNNPHGLPPKDKVSYNTTTAYDLGILARELVNYPKYLHWSSTQLDSFRAGSFQLLNTNRSLLRSFSGMDGLKTGFHRKAGFNLVSTAKRDGVRLVSVVTGTYSPKVRGKITASILNKGFELFNSGSSSSFQMTIVQNTHNPMKFDSSEKSFFGMDLSNIN